MRTKRPRRLTPLALSFALAVIATLAAGCSKDDGHDAGAQATVPTAPSTTTTTAPADPYAVPDDVSKIDADYVNRVLAALNHVYGDLIRKRVATGTFEPADVIALQAIYSEPALSQQVEVNLKSVVPSPSQLRQPLGDARMTVTRLLTVRTDCVSALVEYDFSEVRTDPPPAQPWYVALARKRPEADPKGLNPTPWSLTYENDDQVDQCAG